MRKNVIHLLRKLKDNFFILGIASLFWLVIRSGFKPSRIRYPCQKAAALNVWIMISLFPFGYFKKIIHFFRYKISRVVLFRYLLKIIAIFIVVYGAQYFYEELKLKREWYKYNSVRNITSKGKPLITFSGFLFTGCGISPQTNSLDTVIITYFAFNLEDNPDKGLTSDVIGDIKDATINLIVPYNAGPYIDMLIPSIVYTGETIEPGDGVATDFTNPVKYTVTAANGTTKDYTVSVTVVPDYAKDIIDFNFTLADNPDKGLTSDVIGDIKDTTVNLIVPYDTGQYVDVLIPSIVHLGEAIEPGDGVPIDFTDPVKYTVTAANGTTKDYTVSVTVDTQQALPSLHRVVSVHNSSATSWSGSGNPSSDMDQIEIEKMVERGVMKLTDTANPVDGWKILIPYEEGEAVAIKLNFNNTWDCVSGFTSNPAMNPYPALVNAVIKGLKSIGVPSNNIWLTDPSRSINDAFRSGIEDTNVHYYTKCSVEQIGGRTNVFHTGFVDDGSDYSTQADRGDGTMEWINPAEVFVNADHIINVPQLKGHGGASITLGLKNHFGSVDFTENASGSHYLHNYFYVNTGGYSSEHNILADISNNPVFREKTRLILGDGLMGHPTSNTSNPILWETFDNNPPESLFFGVDPVAADSVMFDYIQRECIVINVSPRNDYILQYASNIGLGVFEHWNNDNDRKYNVIDYIEIDIDNDN